jgi:hypothetical protein
MSDGVFSGSNRFFFRSGTLAGKGQFIFESLNMSTPALKQINATTTVRGLLWVQPGAGQNALINVAQQTLTVAGALQTEEALTIYSDDTQSASLDITGSLNYNGPSKQFIIRGYASINMLNINNGQLTIQNSVDITNTMIGQGGSVTIIGGPENQRNFGNVSGVGTLTVQGGTNTIKGANLGTLQMLAGKLTSTSPLTFTNAMFTGGELAGKATVKITSASFGSVTITSCAITTANLDVAGFSTLSAGASLTVTGSGKVSTAAQFTLNAGSVFSIAASAQFAQGNNFGVVPGADPTPSTLNNDGTWTSSTNANIVVNTQGRGAWVSTASSNIAVTGVTFTIGSAQVAGVWKFLGVTGTIPTLNGGGLVELNGKVFTIGTSSIGTLNHVNGQTTITSGTVGTLSVGNGNFIVSKLSVQSLNFTAGVIAGATTSGSTLNSARTMLNGEAPKFVNNLKLISDEINWSCLGGSCQIVTNNAVFQTSTFKH